ncbi:MAG TPA: YihY/virulence factor BrkB family protein [Xanthobacteraceae bacterium]|nr:YihY/virulence factor BrkB family protein [Xanthobacteraceae bacterium]
MRSRTARNDRSLPLFWSLVATGVAAGLLLNAGGQGARRAASARAAAPATAGSEEPAGSREPQGKQIAGAREAGRGRHAASPLAIPARGWKDILWRTYEEMNRDRVLAVAAGVVYYALLALFPAITALVSSYGLFADMNTVASHLEALAQLVPAGGFDIVRDQIARITAGGPSELSLAFAFSLALAMWSANAGMKAIFDALNVVYDEDEKRGFFTLNAVSLLFTFGAIASALVAVAVVVVFPLGLAFLGVQGLGPTLASVLRWPVMFVVIVLGLSVLYRFGPSRRNAEWRWLSVGSAVAAFAWILGSLAFSYYLANFADYNATYGSLGAVIGLMIWMWLSVVVILLGAELNAEIEHQTARDTTQGREKPLGRRGAAMADTVGAARA